MIGFVSESVERGWLTEIPRNEACEMGMTSKRSLMARRSSDETQFDIVYR